MRSKLQSFYRLVQATFANDDVLDPVQLTVELVKRMHRGAMSVA